MTDTIVDKKQQVLTFSLFATTTHLLRSPVVLAVGKYGNEKHDISRACDSKVHTHIRVPVNGMPWDLHYKLKLAPSIVGRNVHLLPRQ